MKQDALRLIIRRKLAQGDLPHDSIPRFWGGPANNEECDACEETISGDELIMEGISTVTDEGIQLHVECFYVWDTERGDRGRLRRSMEEQRKFKDKWDDMVSIPCPLGDHIAARVPTQLVEGKTELVGVVCQHPGCGHRFDWKVQKAR